MFSEQCSYRLRCVQFSTCIWPPRGPPYCVMHCHLYDSPTFGCSTNSVDTASHCVRVATHTYENTAGAFRGATDALKL